MKELVFATHNNHKAREIQSVLKGRYKVLDLKQLKYRNTLPENRDTLEGNAAQKAWHIFNIFRKDCFADDTGLEVDCLKGDPGVYSARYAEMTGDQLPGETASEANINKLLKKMEGVSNRRARFRTVICLILNKNEYLFEGVVEGNIINEKRGREGFGYDPVFLPDGYQKTFAEMSLEEKNRISHRAKAIEKLLNFLSANQMQ